MTRNKELGDVDPALVTQAVNGYYTKPKHSVAEMRSVLKYFLLLIYYSPQEWRHRQKHIWQWQPPSWPKNLRFKDPNNGQDKPKKKALEQMIKHLHDVYNENIDNLPLPRPEPPGTDTTMVQQNNRSETPVLDVEQIFRSTVMEPSDSDGDLVTATSGLDLMPIHEDSPVQPQGVYSGFSEIVGVPASAPTSTIRVGDDSVPVSVMQFDQQPIMVETLEERIEVLKLKIDTVICQPHLAPVTVNAELIKCVEIAYKTNVRQDCQRMLSELLVLLENGITKKHFIPDLEARAKQIVNAEGAIIGDLVIRLAPTQSVVDDEIKVIKERFQDQVSDFNDLGLLQSSNADYVELMEFSTQDESLITEANVGDSSGFNVAGFCTEKFVQSGQLYVQPNTQLVVQPITQLVEQPIGQPYVQPNTEAIEQLFVQPNTQPLEQLFVQPNTQPIGQLNVQQIATIPNTAYKESGSVVVGAADPTYTTLERVDADTTRDLAHTDAIQQIPDNNFNQDEFDQIIQANDVELFSGVSGLLSDVFMGNPDDPLATVCMA